MKYSWLLILCGGLLLAPLAGAQEAGPWQAVEGLWRIEYEDSVRGLVRGEVSVRPGLIMGIMFNPKGRSESFESERFEFSGSRLKGSFWPSFARTKVELQLVGRDRLVGRWKTRGNTKEPGAREGTRVYEKPDTPYWFEASGKSVWTRLRPQIRRIVVKSAENDALDYSKMEGHWNTAIVGNNLPKISVDLIGQGLPLYYRARYFRLENSNDTVRFHTMEEFPKENRLRLNFYLLKGAVPGPKKMKLNGSEFVVPLVFTNYLKDDKREYQISGHEIDTSGMERKKAQRSAEIEALEKQIEFQKVRLGVRQKSSTAAREKLGELNGKVRELVKKLKPMLKRARDGQFTGNIDKKTASTLARRRYLQGRIYSIEEEITERGDKAKAAEKAGRKAEAKKILDQTPELLKELALQQADLKVLEQSIAPFLKSSEKSRLSVKKQINDLRVQYSGLDRQRDYALEAVFEAQKKLDDDELELRVLVQDLAELTHERDAQAKSRALQIEGVRVSDYQNDTTYYFARRSVDPAEAIPNIDDLIAESAASLAAAKDTYLAWRSEFEEYFDEARYRQRLLGGATGKIMQSAWLQAGSEAFFYFLDLIEDYREGGLPLVVGDLVVKVIQASRDETLTIDNLGDEQVKALRSILLSQRSNNHGLMPMKDFISNLETRAGTETLGVFVKGPLRQAILSASSSPDKNVFRSLKKGISKEITDYRAISRALFSPKTFTKTFSSKVGPSFANLGKEIAKDFANQTFKNFAKSLEEEAYLKYIAADLTAIDSFKIFQWTREFYWQAWDRHQEILEARAEILRRASKFDKETSFGLQKNIKFPSGRKLKISIFHRGSTGDFFKEDVFLNGIKTNPGTFNKHYQLAKFLNENDEGKVKVVVRPRAIK